MGLLLRTLKLQNCTNTIGNTLGFSRSRSPPGILGGPFLANKREAEKVYANVCAVFVPFYNSNRVVRISCVSACESYVLAYDAPDSLPSLSPIDSNVSPTDADETSA